MAPLYTRSTRPVRRHPGASAHLGRRSEGRRSECLKTARGGSEEIGNTGVHSLNRQSRCDETSQRIRHFRNTFKEAVDLLPKEN